MIYIEENTISKLPKTHHKNHNLCVLLYDQLLNVLDKEQLTKTNFDYDPKTQILINELRNKEVNILDWLKENNLNKSILEFLEKEITRAVSADFSKYIYHALNAAQMGQMTVAYSLLRKPLTDELLILEQLLNDPDDFINRFFYIGNPTKYDPSSEKSKENIIESAVQKIDLGYLFEFDFIHNLRYDKEMGVGFNRFSNQSIHIVTNDRNYKTPNQSLNFVFNSKTEIDFYWTHFYELLPYLLIYSYSVIDEILYQYWDEDKTFQLKNLRNFHRWCAFQKYIGHNSAGENKNNYGNLKMLNLICPKCHSHIHFEKADLELFLQTNHIICPKCIINVEVFEETVSSILKFMDGFKNRCEL